jgi:hypothetical protein
MFFFAWVRNFAYNYLGTFDILTFILDFNFIVFLIQSFKHSINLHILIYANIYQISLKYHNKIKIKTEIMVLNFVHAFNLPSIFVIKVKKLNSML